MATMVFSQMADSGMKIPKPPSHPAEEVSADPRITLNDLSNEILINIIRHLPVKVQMEQARRPYGSSALATLSVCSKRFYELVEPVIYSHFLEEFTGNPNALQLFLKRILARPDLGARVKTYHGLATDSRHHDNHMDLTCFGKEEWAIIKARVREVSEDTTKAEDWLEAIEEGDWEAVTAVTLSLTPNIEHLEIEGWGYDNEVYPNLLRVFSRAVHLQESGDHDNPLSMSHIKSIQQDYWDTEAGFGLDLLVPLLSLPSIERFGAKMVLDETGADLIVPSFPHIKHLELDPANIEHETLKVFLKSFPNLETLYYQSGHEGCEIFEPPRMMAALEHLKPSLRSLSVFLCDMLVGASAIEEFPLGSFVHFPNLREICTDIVLLIGSGEKFDEDDMIEGFHPAQNLVDCLPASIEHLKFSENQNGREDISAHISALIAHKESHFPSLKKVDLGWEKILYPDKPSPSEPFKHPGFTKEGAVRLVSEFEAAGVKMVMKTLPPQPKYVRYNLNPGDDGYIAPVGFSTGANSRTHYFKYPYEGYETLCLAHNCDSETGMQQGMFW